MNKNEREKQRVNELLEEYSLCELVNHVMNEENDNKQLKDRIDKVIEYINEMCLGTTGYCNYGDDLRPEHIVEMLKGDSNE